MICLELLLYWLVIDYICMFYYYSFDLFLCHQPTKKHWATQQQAAGEHGEGLSNKKLLKALKSAAWGTVSVRADRTEWVGVRNVGMRVGGPSRQCAGWGHLDQSISNLQQGERPQEQGGGGENQFPPT